MVRLRRLGIWLLAGIAVINACMAARPVRSVVGSGRGGGAGEVAVRQEAMLVVSQCGEKAERASPLKRLARLFFREPGGTVREAAGNSAGQNPAASEDILTDMPLTNWTTRGPPGRRGRMPQQMCHANGCSKHASFGWPGDGTYLFCAQHREPGLLDVRNRRCMHPEGCPRRATYGITPRSCAVKTGGTPSPWAFCSRHKRPSDPHLHRRTCASQGCQRIPIFADEGWTRGNMCSRHKKPDQVDVVNPTCKAVTSCSKRACYGLAGGRARACRDHRGEGEVDLVHGSSSQGSERKRCDVTKGRGKVALHAANTTCHGCAYRASPAAGGVARL